MVSGELPPNKRLSWLWSWGGSSSPTTPHLPDCWGSTNMLDLYCHGQHASSLWRCYINYSLDRLGLAPVGCWHTKSVYLISQRVENFAGSVKEERGETRQWFQRGRSGNNACKKMTNSSSSQDVCACVCVRQCRSRLLIHSEPLFIII